MSKRLLNQNILCCGPDLTGGKASQQETHRLSSNRHVYLLISVDESKKRKWQRNKQKTKKANHSVVQSLCWGNLAFSSALFCCVYSMNPAPKHSCMDWRLLFPCPCLKARVSFFKSRVCRARQRCRSWTETGAGAVVGLPVVASGLAEGWACRIAKVSPLCSTWETARALRTWGQLLTQ